MTAEIAIVLPAVVLVLLVCCVLGAAVLGQVRCADAARAGARAAAIGEDREVVLATARQLAGADAQVVIVVEGAWVRVEVSRQVAGDLVGLRGLRASATASAWVEPGGPADPGG
ncbi:TadE family type IV pilus minor pilin [Georgenia sunbinii]|uniref:TadE family type IV pilus minor pilin n=1 Tax=Georgenia sunbinii TaxID=3117728 RepID=UPI002F26C4F0